MAMAATAARADEGRLLFDVRRNGERIGTHELRLRRSGDRIEADIAIDLKVKLAFVTVYRYRHRNHEVYEAGRLLSMSSRTDNNGEKLRVDVARDGDELVVQGSSGALRAPGDLLPTTYWQPRSMAQSRWIDSQNGRLVAGRVERAGVERVAYEGRQIECERYRLRGDLDLDLWYGPEGWAKLAFQFGGSRIDYGRRAESDVASLPQAVTS